MATLRKGKCYTAVTRPYTRRSKFKKKGFIKAVPANRVVRYNMGDLNKSYPYTVSLVSKVDHQIRHNALESARLIINRNLTKLIGKTGYLFQLRLYPHQVLRENKMLSGAHADRLQTGMAHSFGKTVGLAAQVKKDRAVFSISVNKNHLEFAKTSMKKSMARLPGQYSIKVTEAK